VCSHFGALVNGLKFEVSMRVKLTSWSGAGQSLLPIKGCHPKKKKKRKKESN
jgi:hypothetical protein